MQGRLVVKTSQKSEHNDKRHTCVLCDLAICPKKGFKYSANYLEKVIFQHSEKYVGNPDEKKLLVRDIDFQTLLFGFADVSCRFQQFFFFVSI
jgi:hypothetical protein